MEKRMQRKLQRDGMHRHALMRTLEPEITGKHRIQALEKKSRNCKLNQQRDAALGESCNNAALSTGMPE